MFDRMPHASLRCQVKHDVEARIAKQLRYWRSVA
jgi:hypothetical protein